MDVKNDFETNIYKFKGMGYDLHISNLCFNMKNNGFILDEY